MNVVNKGYVLGHTGARSRSRAGLAEWKRIRPCKLAGLLSLVAHSSPLDSLTQARTLRTCVPFQSSRPPNLPPGPREAEKGHLCPSRSVLAALQWPRLVSSTF